jgi:hypothetical protein
MLPLSHVGHVTYSFINMLFITRWSDDKLRPQILSVGTTANAALRQKLYDKRDEFDIPIVNFPFICGKQSNSI